jgi:hypothetical protein
MFRIKAIIPIILGGLTLATTSLSAGTQDTEYANNYGNNFGKGKAFFRSNVLPKLGENGCIKCHARGYLRPNVTKYEELIRRLAIGDSAQNNVVIYKLANIRSISPDIPNHPGGQRCATIDDEPCKSIREWWEIEFGSTEQGQEQEK